MPSATVAPPVLHPAFDACLRALAVDCGVWIVGGYIRDALLQLPPHDADFATNASEETINIAVKKAGLTLIEDRVARAHGIFRLHEPNSKSNLELACLRADGPRIGVRQAAVQFVTSIEMDLARRDLTINAMAMPFVQSAGVQGPLPTLVDPFDGQAHLELRLLKFVGDPNARLEEDPLRLLRLARFACLGNAWRIDATTCAALGGAAPKLAALSRERIREEVLRAFAMPAPERFWQVVAKARAQHHVLPLTLAPSASLSSAILWLKHTARKTAVADTRVLAFFLGLFSPLDAIVPDAHVARGHGQFVAASLHALRCSRAWSTAMAHAVRQFPWQPIALQQGLLARWLIATGEVGYQMLRPLLDLADELMQQNGAVFSDLMGRVQTMVGDGPWPHVSAMAVGGKEVMQVLRIKPGPVVGEVVAQLLEWATARGQLTNRAALLRRLESMSQ